MQPTPRKPDSPTFWIIAGPNGSGKSSFYNRSDIEGWGGSVWIINPDLLTAAIVEREGLTQSEANLAAVERIELWLDASLEVYQTIGVETVLSSPKYRRLVGKAQAQGFKVKLIYIALDSAELQIERVRMRVAEGGHDVPQDKIVSRRAGSFAQLAWFFDHVDQCLIFDNSTGEPELLAEKMGGVLFRWSVLPKDMQVAFDDADISSARGVDRGGL